MYSFQRSWLLYKDLEYFGFAIKVEGGCQWDHSCGDGNLVGLEVSLRDDKVVIVSTRSGL
jgi:hypothetical protein